MKGPLTRKYGTEISNEESGDHFTPRDINKATCFIWLARYRDLEAGKVVERSIYELMNRRSKRLEKQRLTKKYQSRKTN